MDDFRHPGIESPCIKICVVEPESGYCIGCGRSRDEIGSWIGMTPEQRRSVMQMLPERVATLTQRKTRRGGRRGRLGAAV